ncbi:hypothetical protein NHH03_07675 [Stieleria sp. TO1_6]|uniref:hypothetical protein n=1 Tax=Stieleria tagensis TaxID=2956795 RepID=UPI00209AAB80|nr:hypothetical protein [Stieleria tagensis]MCO8121611.1 hypothetical protein [Stieleria tagensis]
MSDSINPYQSPSSSGGDALAPSAAGDWIGSRMQFAGQLSRLDCRDAVTQAGIRSEYRQLTRVMVTLATLYSIGVIAYSVMVPLASPQDTIRCVVAIALFLAGVVLICLYQRQLLGNELPSYQLAIGAIEGWIDRDELWLQSDRHTLCCPMSQLVSSAASQRIWALSFVRDKNFWQTIPFDAFTDPALARSVAADLQQQFPPVAAQLIDARKRSKPEDEFRFQPIGDSVCYQGYVYEDSASGTLLEQASRRRSTKAWATMLMFFGAVLASIVVMGGFQPILLIFLLIWGVYVIASVYLKIWRARRTSKLEDRVIAWYSKGWLDQAGYCAMTAVGQSRSSWNFFDHYEITERVIGLYPHQSNACCCLIAREQFADDGDWQQAQSLVLANASQFTNAANPGGLPPTGLGNAQPPGANSEPKRD